MVLQHQEENDYLCKYKLNQMKLEPNLFPSYFENGWRRELLGDDLISWLKNRSPLNVEMIENQWVIMEKKKWLRRRMNS